MLECTSSGACNGGYINDALQTIVNKKGKNKIYKGLPI